MTEPMAPAALMRKLVVRTTIWLILLAVLLFATAGTFRWPGAWIYLAWAAIISFGGGLWLARHDPALLNERLGSLIQRDQKGWDKLFMVMVLVLWFAWFALMGLDVRYRWSHVPLYAQIVGFLLLILGCYLVWLTFRANSFAAPVVKIQKSANTA
jgi:protein-S-isoprenylcysteine O-methyltransferase Ste14